MKRIIFLSAMTILLSLGACNKKCNCPKVELDPDIPSGMVIESRHS